MTSAVLVDTDVVSFFFKKDTRARPYRPHLVGRTLLISFMTLAELRFWALCRRWGHEHWERLARHLQGYLVCYADDVMCDLWAQVSDRARRRGRPMEVGDAWVAATALALGVPLATHNAVDFASIDGLKVVSAGP